MSKSRGAIPEAGVPRRRLRRKRKQPAFPVLEPLARRLESLRLERGLTQRVLAARADISTNHYQDIAHAEANPTIVVLQRLAGALGVPITRILDAFSLAESDHRQVRAADINELVAAHEGFADVVDRLTKQDRRSRIDAVNAADRDRDW